MQWPSCEPSKTKSVSAWGYVGPFSTTIKNEGDVHKCSTYFLFQNLLVEENVHFPKTKCLEYYAAGL